MSDHDDFGAFLIGFVVGGVAGAVAALLLAPQTGEETRTLLRDKSIELRDQAAQQADVIATKAGQVATQAKSRGKDLVDSAKKVVVKKRPPEEAGE
ncbi:MAG: YtxH domain-containing protein [Anaerolineales bacterium]|jgi:gas vesicle protein